MGRRRNSELSNEELSNEELSNEELSNEELSNEELSMPPDVKPDHVTVIGLGTHGELWKDRIVENVPLGDAEYLEEIGAVKIKW